MIDCNITANYFAKKERLCASILECIDCPLRHGNDCTNIENKYPKRAISIVQKWSDEHQKKTYLSEFLKHYPNAVVNGDGIPDAICPYDLGLTNKHECERTCIECWNQHIKPIKDGEE